MHISFFQIHRPLSAAALAVIACLGLTQLAAAQSLPITGVILAPTQSTCPSGCMGAPPNCYMYSNTPGCAGSECYTACPTPDYCTVACAAGACPVQCNQYIAKPGDGVGPYYNCVNFAADTIAWMQCEGIPGYSFGFYCTGSPPPSSQNPGCSCDKSGHATTVYPVSDNGGEYCVFDTYTGLPIPGACWPQTSGYPNPPQSILMILIYYQWPACQSVNGIIPQMYPPGTV